MTTQTRTDRRTFSDLMSDWPIRLAELGRLVVAYLVLSGIGLAIGFLITDAPMTNGLRELDTEVARELVGERSPDLDEATSFGSSIAGTIQIVAALVVVGAILLMVLRRWRETATLWAALSLEAVTFLTVSILVGRDRPPVEQLDASPPTASFPSGHTGASAAFYLCLALFAWWWTKRTSIRVIAAVLGLGAVLVVALSRMYRGMHFLTDVTVGALLGAACLAVAVDVVRRGIERREAMT